MCQILASLSRLVLIVANFVFSLFGILLLVLGIFWTVRYVHYKDGVPSKYSNIKDVPIYALAVGSLLFLIAFQGCWGAFKRKKWLLLSYSVILLAIFLLHVTAGIYGLVQLNGSDMKKHVDDQLTELFLKYKEKNETVDLIQRKLECCGVASSSWWDSQGLSVPNSCYSPTEHTLFKVGCSEAMLALIRSSLIMLCVLMLIAAALEVSGALLALHLSCYIISSNRPVDSAT